MAQRYLQRSNLAGRMRRVCGVAACVLGAVACDPAAAPDGTADDESNASPSPQLSPPPAAPEPLTPPGGAAGALQGPAAPALGCTSVAHMQVGEALGPARLVAGKRGLWLASYARRNGVQQLARFHFAPAASTPRALPELSLGDAESGLPALPPALSLSESLWVATVNAKGELQVFPQADVDRPERTAVAQHVDRRFTPALRALSADRALVAWTEGDATGMRVQAARLEGRRVQKHSVTPLGHGAAAPRFVLGTAAPQLLMLDARSGISPLLAVPFSSSGQPGEATVWRPVSQPYAPPSLLGLALPKRPVQVAYTAIGNAATAAVGIVRVDTPDPPQALLRGEGYALLAVDAALGPRRAVFVFDAPQGSQPSPELEVHVRVWDGERAGPPLVLKTPEHSEKRPAIAYDPSRGLFAVARVRGSALLLDWLHCDA